jgi:hypothetical protein
MGEKRYVPVKLHADSTDCSQAGQQNPEAVQGNRSGRYNCRLYIFEK